MPTASTRRRARGRSLPVHALSVSVPSLREAVASLLVVRLGNNLPPAVTASEGADAVARLLDRHPIGGLILFNGRWPDTRDALLRLQARSDRGLLVTTDMERGLGQQVAGATIYPHSAAWARWGDAEAVRTFAAQASREALACGIHVTYSPVADVDRNAANPIIGARAFGSDPAEAARLTAAFVEGAHDAGQFATAKHFPGHGGTADDSHATLPTVADPRETMEATDLVPFRAAFAAGCDLVMTAHVVYPALDPSGRPATQSAPILRGLLRDRMGFDGVVVTDSLQMAGAQEAGVTEGEMAVRLLDAGVDLFVDAVDPEGIVEGVARAVEDGRLEADVVHIALARVQRLRDRLTDRFGAGVFRDPSLAYAPETVGRPEHAALADACARHAAEWVRGGPQAHGVGAGTLVVALRRPPLPTETGLLPLASFVAERLPGAAYAEFVPGVLDDAARASLDAQVETAERVLLFVVARPAAWHAFGLPDAERAWAENVIASRPTTLVVLGDRRGLAGFDGAERAVVAYSDVPASQRAALDLICGR